MSETSLESWDGGWGRGHWGGGGTGVEQRQTKRKSRGEGNDEQRKRLGFQKGFLLQKGPSHSPLTSTTDSSHLKPDRCAGGCRQESSLCVVKLFFFFFFLWL